MLLRSTAAPQLASIVHHLYLLSFSHDLVCPFSIFHSLCGLAHPPPRRLLRMGVRVRSETAVSSMEEKPLLDPSEEFLPRSRAQRSQFRGLACSFIGVAVLGLVALLFSPLRTSPSSLLCSPVNLPLPPPSPSTLEPLNHCRLLSSLSRLRGGEPLRFAAVGGSITRAGPPAFSWLELAVKRLNEAKPPKENSATSSVDSTLTSIRSAVHRDKWGGPPHRHLSRNLAMGGIPSSFVSTCLSSFFPDHSLGVVDVLFVEFAVNDLSYAGNVTVEQSQGAYFQAVARDEMSTGGQMGEFDPATNMERIIRYALSQTVDEEGLRRVEGPAVILMEFCEMEGINAAGYHNPIAHHYGVPVISVCELLPFSYPNDEDAGVAKRQGGMMRDQSHPTLPGHAVASAMLTDRLLNQLLPQVDNPAVMSRCQAWQEGGGGGAVTVSPAMFPINEAATDYKCTLGQFTPGRSEDMLTSLHFPSFRVVDAGGWVYQDETGKGKFGWSTSLINSTLTLSLQPTTRHVILSYLRSYANIGSARCWLTGEPGYISPAFEINAWWPRAFSTFELMQIPQSVVRDIPEGLTALSLHLQLLNVGEEVVDPPVQRPANRFKLVGVFELTEKHH